MGALRLHEVAELVGGRCLGDPDTEVAGVGPVDDARSDEIGFLASARYVRHVASCRASSFLVSEELADQLPAGRAAVVVAEPYPALQQLLTHFHPLPAEEAGVHPTAVLGPNVRLGAGVTVGPYAVLAEGVEVGDGTRIGAHVVLGARTRIGTACRLHPHVVTYHETEVGNGVEIHAGARLGSDGFGYTLIDGAHAKIPQVGRCIVEDDVEIGANATIDRGSLGDTRLGRGVKLDNLVHVAHNVRIGAHSLLAALVGIAGSTRIGRGVFFGGQSGAVNQLEVGDGVRVVVQSGLTRDVPAGETVSGFPARPHREVLRRDAMLNRLSRLRARVDALEAELGALRAEPGGDDESGA